MNQALSDLFMNQARPMAQLTRRLRPWLASAFLASVSLGGAVGCSPKPALSAERDGGKFHVEMNRPWPSARAFQIQLSKTEKMGSTTSLEGQVLKQEESQATTAFSGQKKSVGTAEAQEFEYLVDSFTEAQNGESREILPKGSVIYAKDAEGMRGYRLAEGELDEVAQKALARLFGGNADSQSAKLFNPTAPVAVGDSWEIDEEVAIADLRDEALEAEGVQGKSQLVDRKVVDGVDVLVVHSEMELLGFAIPGLPEQAEMTKTDARLNFEVHLPVDESLPPTYTSVKMSIAAVMSIQSEQGEVVVEFDTTTHEVGKCQL